MKTEYEKALVDFLKKPENLRFTLEIAEHINLVHREIFLDFWMKMKQSIEENLKEYGLQDEWSVDFNSDDPSEQYYCLMIGFQSTFKRPVRLVFGIEQSESRGKFFIGTGVAYRERLPEDPQSIENLAEFQKLQKWLEKSGCKKSLPWWPGYIELHEYPSRNQFLMDFSERRDDLIEDLVDIAFKLFHENYQLISAVCTAIKEVKKLSE